jgi:putative oxidoreductase
VTSKKELFASLGLCALRLGVGVQLLALHGWDLLDHFTARMPGFPDPFKVGNKHSLIAAIMAEVFCAGLLALGLATRAAALLVAFVTGVLACVVQSGAPWARRETMLLYFTGSLAILLLGPGRLSLDGVLFGRKSKGATPVARAAKSTAAA